MIIRFKQWGEDASGGQPQKPEQSKSITITENRTTSVTPDEGKVLSSVEVTTDVHPMQRFSTTITENGTIGFGGEWSGGEITTDVHPAEKLTTTITENGTTELTGEWKDASITVNVAGGATKVDVGELGIMLSNSTFSQVPDIFDFNNCTTFDHMFYSCNNLVSVPAMDTSKVTDMSNAFSWTRITNIPAMDTSNVIRMTNMFHSCSSLASVPAMDTSKVRLGVGLFQSCASLTEIAQIDISLIRDFYGTFNGCTSLTSLTLVGSINATIKISDSPLDEESIKSVLTAASKTVNTDTKTLTFKSGSAFTDDAAGTWAAMVADCTSKGWTVENLTIKPAA